MKTPFVVKKKTYSQKEKILLKSNFSELDAKINARNSMQNLDELRQADSNGDGILSLNEIKNCKNKSEFMEKLEQAMIKFNSNPNRDYSKNLFEEWV